MVVVYLPTGHSIQLPRATHGDVERLPGSGQGYNGFVFRDADAKIVAIFRLEQVAGWAIEPEETPNRTGG
jgi:hypothetical protein